MIWVVIQAPVVACFVVHLSISLVNLPDGLCVGWHQHVYVRKNRYSCMVPLWQKHHNPDTFVFTIGCLERLWSWEMYGKMQEQRDGLKTRVHSAGLQHFGHAMRADFQFEMVLPRPPKGSKRLNLPIISSFPNILMGLILGGSIFWIL